MLAHLMLVSKKIVTVLKEIYHLNDYSIMQNGEVSEWEWKSGNYSKGESLLVEV